MNEELPIVKPTFHFGLRGMFFAIKIVGVLFALLAPLIVATRDAARLTQSKNNVARCVMAMHSYCDVHKCFPRAIDRDATGSPMLSWRVTIVPYLEATDFYSRYDHQQAWDSPVNDALGRQYAFGESLYNRPGNSRLNRHCTNFVVVTGPETLFPTDGYSTFGDLTHNGTGNTMMVMEIDHSDILWYEPRDYPISALSMVFNDPQSDKLYLGSRQSQGAIIGFADGSARLLPKDSSARCLPACLKTTPRSDIIRL